MKYKITYSKRKTLSLEVNQKGEIYVRAPKNTKIKSIDNFVYKNRPWIIRKKKRALDNHEKLKKLNFNSLKKNEHMIFIKKDFRKRLNLISDMTGLSYKDFRLSNAKKRWGSCNKKGVVSLNWRLVFTPKEVIDYVILHELAHVKYLNHSKMFWSFLEKYNKDYKLHRKKLKEFEYLLLID